MRTEKLATAILRGASLSPQAAHQEGTDVTVVTSCEIPDLSQRLRGEGFRVISVGGTHSDQGDWGFLSREMEEHPEWLELNQHVKQKTIGGDTDATKNHD